MKFSWKSMLLYPQTVWAWLMFYSVIKVGWVCKNVNINCFKYNLLQIYVVFFAYGYLNLWFCYNCNKFFLNFACPQCISVKSYMIKVYAAHIICPKKAVLLPIFNAFEGDFRISVYTYFGLVWEIFCLCRVNCGHSYGITWGYWLADREVASTVQ